MVNEYRELDEAKNEECSKCRRGGCSSVEEQERERNELGWVECKNHILGIGCRVSSNP